MSSVIMNPLGGSSRRLGVTVGASLVGHQPDIVFMMHGLLESSGIILVGLFSFEGS